MSTRPGIGPNDPQEEADAALLSPLGEFMQRRNAELGLSVSVVAQRVGMSRATWYRIARGESASPDLRLLRGLARVYKVRADELFALAANTATPPAPSPAKAAQPRHEAGDVLWRCRHERRVRAGTWVDVQLELRNLSDRAWTGAEVRSFHDGWLRLGEAGKSPQPGCGTGPGLPPCRAPLAPTGPGEWVQAQLRLRAPPAAGPCVFCLALCMPPAMSPTGAGVFLFVDIQ